jgi:helvolic acid biosynthesis cytochrome C16-acyltransferase
MEDFLRQLKSQTYELSPLDIVPSHLYLTNAFFIANNHGEDDITSFLSSEVLKESFYDALGKFPILAGRLERSGLNRMSIVVDQDDPNLPHWEESQTDQTFNDLRQNKFDRDFWPQGMEVTDPLVHGDVIKPPRLARVHVWRFAENTGVAIVIRLAHSVFDAKGCTFFINHWAGCCRRRLDPQADVSLASPVLDRTVMYSCLPPSVQVEPRSRVLLWPISAILTAILALVGWFIGKRTTTGTSESHLFRISRGTLDQLRKVEDGAKISDNDVIVAVFTMLYAQLRQVNARKLPKEIKAIVPCDFRHRLGVAESFTGSCAVGLYVAFPSTLLLQPMSSSMAIRSAAATSRKTIDGTGPLAIENLVKRAMMAIRMVGDRARILYSLMVCQAFSNQSRLPFYEVDFGNGNLEFVVPMAYSKSLSVVFPSPPQSSDVYVYLTLEVKDMEAALMNKDFLDIVDVVY